MTLPVSGTLASNLENRVLLEIPYDLAISNARSVPPSTTTQPMLDHQRLNNITPADGYLGLYRGILKQRERVKCKTVEVQRSRHNLRAAQSVQPKGAELDQKQCMTVQHVLRLALIHNCR